ncbi:hypothetical protein HPP92_006849 [Vanilla planifolia]|uniref:Uncharacterized protein n=1 Tax=Vanilla planifolia TaxID=51239 RepID=A0A835VBB4_VANPL|nr:hypothetical protein HPP92_006849 [Vanilla planifolia]
MALKRDPHRPPVQCKAPTSREGATAFAQTGVRRGARAGADLGGAKRKSTCMLSLSERVKHFLKNPDGRVLSITAAFHNRDQF